MWCTWERGEVFTGFWLEGLKGRDHWEDLGMGGRIILRWMDLREIGIDAVNWSWLPQDRVQCWTFVNMVMNLHVL